MAPTATLTLRGFPPSTAAGTESPSNQAFLLNLPDSVLEDAKTSASASSGGLHFVTGHSPHIRLGKRVIDLTISSEAFRHELYTASAESRASFDFVGLATSRAQPKPSERASSMGSDAALAALQNSLASYQQEKQAKSVNISDKVVKEHKNRWEAAREQRQAQQRKGLLGSRHTSPSRNDALASHSGLARTATTTSDAAARMQAMRTPLVHLLAMRPLSQDEVSQKTRIAQSELCELLQKVAKHDAGKWTLQDRAYKDLDVWKFRYSSPEDRQAAIDSAIKAYDRMRLGKDEKMWQMLLHQNERDKGIVLSKLHLGPKLTPHLAATTPVLNGDRSDGKQANAARSPHLGPAAAATPKIGSGKSDSSALSKRLFAKDPKRARAVEDAKERKRKDREAAAAAAASDKEAGKPPRKRQTTKANSPKVKSAAIVHDSSAEDDPPPPPPPKRGVAANAEPPKPTANGARAAMNAPAKPKPNPVERTAAGRDKATKTRTPIESLLKRTTPRNTPAASSHPTVTSTSKPTGTLTKVAKPAPQGGSGSSALSAPAPQHKSQLSPNGRSRPTVPSPLGAARPRVASDVSDRGAVGVQRVRQGADTPQGLGITNGFRKRHDTVTSSESFNPDPSHSGRKDDRPLKRKAVDSPPHAHEPGAKHRKTASASASASASSPSHSHSHPQHNYPPSASSSSVEASRADRTATATTTSETGSPSRPSSSSSLLLEHITYRQGVNLAREFHDKYYPTYARMYDAQAAAERRGETVPRDERERLWAMHRRLEQMKRQIRAASAREEGMVE